MFKRIAHVCLSSKDLRRSIEYYAKLGMKPAFKFSKDGRDFGVYLELAPGNFIEIFERGTGQKPLPNTGISHFCLEIDDIDRAIATLDQAGVEHTDKKLGCDQSWQIWLTDPDGNSFELHQYTAQSSQITRTDAVVNW